MFKEIKKHSNMKFKKTSKEIEKCLLNSHDYFILTERFLLHPVWKLKSHFTLSQMWFIIKLNKKNKYDKKKLKDTPRFFSNKIT